MMDLVRTLPDRLPEPVVERLYRAQQRAWQVPSIAVQVAIRRAFGLGLTPSREQIAAVERRRDNLLALDLENVHQGLYPRSLLFQIPLATYAKRLPRLAVEIPRTVRRMRTRDHRDLPQAVDLKRYPAYFRRTFHWQSDGYLSERSADLYDFSVEFLFAGMADVMRRQIIPPVTRFVRAHGTDIKVLDVGTGTGRALRQLATTHPALRYYGLDLSPFYLRHAQKLLGDVEHVSLVADNAEAMPFASDHFDVLTSVYLFHELPRRARAKVYAEMFRVLRPGGLLVIQDSAQRSESEDLSFQLDNFAEDFHEPFHADYMVDPVEDALRVAGFEVESVERHHLSKTVVARKG